MADNAYTQAINNALTSAKSMLGKNEVPNHAELQSYLRDGGQDLDPHKLAWCAAFVSASLQKAGLPVPTQVIKDSAFGPGAYAGNYLSYGSSVEPKGIQAGDILVANNGSHVGFAEGPVRNGPNGPEVQLLAGNEKDLSGQYQPGSYTNPATGAVANRAQVGQVGERWVPLSQYSARRYQQTDDTSQSSGSNASASAPAPTQGTTINSAPTAVTASTPFSLAPPTAGIPSAGQFQPLIDTAAKKYNLDPKFLGRVLWQENRFRPEGTSKAGAQGIAQFMPGTAARYGVDVHDPGSSIEGAAHYLSDLSGRYSGNLGLAAAGYNWGEGNVDKWLQGTSKPPPETTNYVNTITGHSMDEWRADPRLPLGSSGPGRSPSGPSPPTSTIPGTTINSTPAAGLAGQMPQLAQNLKKTLGLPDDSQDQGQGQQPETKPSQMIGPAPQAHNVSFLLGNPQVYEQRMAALGQPMTWGANPPGQMPGTGYGVQAQPSVYGTSLMSNLGRSLDPMWMNSWGT